MIKNLRFIFYLDAIINRNLFPVFFEKSAISPINSNILYQNTASTEFIFSSNDKPITYKIVGNLESEPESGLISIQTPIAQGLMGKNVGDQVSISTPSGTIDFEIEKVKHL